MKKLYLLDPQGKNHRYHEAWVDGKEVIEHFGTLGTRGTTRSHANRRFSSEKKNIQRILKSAVENGFSEISIEEHSILLIEFEVNGFGCPEDLEKRYALQDRMDETLGWTGLGHCDGGSIGSGTMEVCCFVVDFKIAKQTIENDLQGTQFANFSRIYDENAGLESPN